MAKGDRPALREVMAIPSLAGARRLCPLGNAARRASRLGAAVAGDMPDLL
jgi:hypothetical protein